MNTGKYSTLQESIDLFRFLKGMGGYSNRDAAAEVIDGLKCKTDIHNFLMWMSLQ